MTRRLDLRGRKSPYPIVRIAKVVMKGSPGDRFEFLVSDKASVDDVYGWVERTGNVLRRVDKKDGYWLIEIERR